MNTASVGIKQKMLELLWAAVGGSVAIRGWDLGEQERKRISDAITAVGSAPPT